MKAMYADPHSDVFKTRHEEDADVVARHWVRRGIIGHILSIFNGGRSAGWRWI